MKKSNKVLWGFIGVIFAVVLILSVLRSVNDTSSAHISSSFYFNFSGDKKIIGNQMMTDKSVALGKFDAVSIGENFDVVLNSGAKNSVTITSDKNILPYINIVQENNQLSLGVQPGVTLSSTQPKKVIITSSAMLHQINISGLTTLHAINVNSDDLALNMNGRNSADIQGKIKQMQINLDGKSRLHLKLIDAENVVLNINGMGAVELSGNTQNLTIRTNGKASVSANDLVADSVVITGRGMSDISVHAVKTLSVLSSGKSSIQYSGNPKVSKNTFGNTTVEQISDD